MHSLLHAIYYTFDGLHIGNNKRGVTRETCEAIIIR